MIIMIICFKLRKESLNKCCFKNTHKLVCLILHIPLFQCCTRHSVLQGRPTDRSNAAAEQGFTDRYYKRGGTGSKRSSVSRNHNSGTDKEGI